MQRFISLCLLFLSGLVCAEEPAEAGHSLSASAQFLDVAGMLAVVLLLIVVMAWAARRMIGGSLKGGRNIKLMEVLPLGRSEKLCLVRVNKKTLLLGVSAQGISRLEKWDDWPEEGETPPPGEFQNLLSRLVKSS